MSLDIAITAANIALGFFAAVLLFRVSAVFRLMCRPPRKDGHVPYRLPAVIAGGAADLDTLVRPQDHFPTDKVR